MRGGLIAISEVRAAHVVSVVVSNVDVAMFGDVFRVLVREEEMNEHRECGSWGWKWRM